MVVKMLAFLNELLENEVFWDFEESVDDEDVHCEDEKINQYIRKLCSIIEKQRAILKRFRRKISEYQELLLTREVSTQTEVEKDVPKTDSNSALTNSWKASNSSVEEMVKEVAESAMNDTGFVYEPSSGLYYDYKSGYYYNAEYGLYYESTTGTYFYYDKEKNTFQFHSQVSVPSNTADKSEPETNTNTTQPSRKRKEKTKHKKKRKLKQENGDVEEGECSDESGSSSNVNSEEDTIDVVVAREALIEEISRAWPPCMRIVVKETNLKNLPIGTLFIVTCNGGTLGREGDHAILISDINISKYHARFSFDSKDEKNEIGNYTLTDLGSRNGTYIDGKRLSTALQESEPHPLLHDCSVRVGGTVLLCHIHPGRETCSQCEPGLLISQQEEKRNAYVLEENLSEKRKKQLKKLKQKFGLSSTNENAPFLANEYKDRAEIRRQEVGSYSDSFKTETASVTEPIKSSNKGFAMLSKMGWSQGEALGAKSGDAITEPILMEQRVEKVGLGYDKPVSAELDESVKKKQDIWKKVQVRYNKLDESME